jgi:hypothetical protein
MSWNSYQETFIQGFATQTEFVLFGPFAGILAGLFFSLTATFLNKDWVNEFQGTAKQFRIAMFFAGTVAACLHFTFIPGIVSGLEAVLFRLGIPDPITFFLASIPTLFVMLFLAKLLAENLPIVGALVKEFYSSFYRANKKA